ncbi:MAG: hypothetical protein JWO02_2297 [Solirubrobacterales bacterium]|nr:hypothetical protein [Solirubrobacterales bacterium]
MSGPHVPVVWGGLLVAIAAVQLTFGMHGTALALLGGAGITAVLVGAAWGARARLTAPVTTTAASAATSPGAATAAAGVGAMALGSAIGAWLSITGGALLLIGVVQVVRQGRR